MNLFAPRSQAYYVLSMQYENNDEVLQEIVGYLRKKHRCHTVILYGSRARNSATSTSDYDVAGICRNGERTRIAKKKNGAYWDVFVYPEKDLKSVKTQFLDWRDAKVIFEEGHYGRNLIRRIQKSLEKPFKPAPRYEIAVTKAWAQKQLDRIEIGDVHGLFRRAELQTASIEHYFQIRRKRFWGPKAGLQWLEKHDPTTFKLFAKVYRDPVNLRALKALVARVYRV